MYAFYQFIKPCWSIVAAVLLALATLLHSPVSHAQYPDNNTPPNTILRVDGLAGSATGNGSAWGQSAFLYLQDAIDLAVSLPSQDKPVAIWVRGGSTPVVYRPDQGANVTQNDRAASFQMINQVRIYGGFAGNESGNLSGFLSRSPLSRITVLSGDIGTANNTSDNSYHIVTADRVNQTAILDGFVIRHGNAIGSSAPMTGALANAGGGMILLGITGTTGVCQPTILRCNFENNRANVGGAVYIFTGQVNGQPMKAQFWNCRFLSNEALDVTVGQTTYPGLGGAVYTSMNPDGSETENPGPETRFINCLFDQNSADLHGGAVYIDWTDTPVFFNCTIVRNTSYHVGGGIYHCWDTQSPHSTCLTTQPSNCIVETSGMTVKNSIIWGNSCQTCDQNSEQHQISGLRWIEYSCVKNLGPCASSPACLFNITSDPLFVDFNNGDFHLFCGSPAKDQGYDGHVPNDPFNLKQLTSNSTETPDLDLGKRIIGSDQLYCLSSPIDVGVDMGVFERMVADTCPHDVNRDGCIDDDDYDEIINNQGACPSTGARPLDIDGDCDIDTTDAALVAAEHCGVAESFCCMECSWGFSAPEPESILTNLIALVLASDNSTEVKTQLIADLLDIFSNLGE